MAELLGEVKTEASFFDPYRGKALPLPLRRLWQGTHTFDFLLVPKVGSFAVSFDEKNGP